MINIDLWLSLPNDVTCPYCKKGIIQWKGSAVFLETRESLVNNEYHKKGLVHPSTEKIVSRPLKCNACDESILAQYIEVEDVRHTDDEGNELLGYLQVQYFPSPPIIEFPASCPSSVKSILQTSFTLFWIDFPSCANKIRVALEQLMNELNIGHASEYLHPRILQFRKANPELGDFLLSIKWLGNSGSHMPSVTKEDVLDAYRLVEYALEQIYNDRQQELTKISSRLTAAHRPQKKP